MKKFKLTLLIACVLMFALAISALALDSLGDTSFGSPNCYYNYTSASEFSQTFNVDYISLAESSLQIDGTTYCVITYSLDFSKVDELLNNDDFARGSESAVEYLGLTPSSEGEPIQMYFYSIINDSFTFSNLGDILETINCYGESLQCSYSKDHFFLEFTEEYYIQQFGLSYISSFEYAKPGQWEIYFDLKIEELRVLLCTPAFYENYTSAVEYLGFSYTDPEAEGFSNYLYWIAQNCTNHNIQDLFNDINHVGGDVLNDYYNQNSGPGSGSNPELEAENEALRSEVNELDAEIDSLNTAVEILTDKLDTANSNYNYYKKLYNAEAEKVSQKNTIIALRDNQIKELQAEVDTLEEALQAGGNEAYMNGFNDGLDSSKVFKNTLITMFSSPTYIFASIFDFELFGINFYQIIKVFITATVVIFLVKVFI